ncbi:MAG: cytochrome-c peroxidase [Flavobacteriales bacterium]|nr:cytochrome-c peroxidase [Flavobacteriales bacterium]
MHHSNATISSVATCSAMRFSAIALLIAFGLIGCEKENPPLQEEEEVQQALEPELPATPFPYSAQAFPEEWLTDPALQLFGNIGSDIEVTDAGATLGRVLFYDPSMSADGTVSCSSCHAQANAFADSEAKSVGVSGVPTVRNAMGLFNFRYQRRFFWDMRTVGLAQQVLEPIAHPDEMALSLAELPVRLMEQPYYAALFEAAFGSEEINSDRVASALAQFLMCMRSYSSRYDAGRSNGFVNFSESERMGKDLFFNGDTRCNQCHSGLNLFSTQPFVNGLELDYAAAGDGGIGSLSDDPYDDGRFKTVSLRNIGLTSPYMHDGRFATLHEVIDFYADGIQHHPYLDERLSVNGFGVPGQEPYQLSLSAEERSALVDFLITFNDTLMTTSEWLSNPF